jgi:hypothetical protein
LSSRMPTWQASCSKARGTATRAVARPHGFKPLRIAPSVASDAMRRLQDAFEGAGLRSEGDANEMVCVEEYVPSRKAAENLIPA